METTSTVTMPYRMFRFSCSAADVLVFRVAAGVAWGSSAAPQSVQNRLISGRARPQEGQGFMTEVSNGICSLTRVQEEFQRQDRSSDNFMSTRRCGSIR